ncbi:DUF58 domain-containing protein [Haloglomus irregulare]|uniref:DUF58 domain-containing protein n=1 Tax=Haloglomus irregulare TaxID=2234134 RepID=UPI001EE25F5D|nr:DUF58 domain-containing protein [Haloglomus irregulare]
MSSPVPDPQLGDPGAADRRATPGEPIDRVTERWRGVTAFALLAAALGVLLSRPALVLAGAAGVLLGGAARAAGPPAGAVAVERTVASERADPGEQVRVTVTVENVGDSLLPDVRVVDGVPGGLTVAEGTPRHATALRPGKRATFSYAVRASRGRHAFGPATVLLRGFTGTVERERSVPAAPPDGAATDGGESTVNTDALACTPELGAGARVPLPPQTTGLAGRVTTDIGGSGTEFHAVREYRRGDPLARVDWARFARTGEFATRQFREERAATVVVVLDTRETSYTAPGADAPTALERSVAAAGTTLVSLLDAGDRAGLAAWGPTACWLAPGLGAAHRARARELLGTHAAFRPTPPERRFLPTIARRRVERRLPADAQVFLCSPLTDDRPVGFGRRLAAKGHRVTVLSPDPTGEGSTGRRLAAVERDRRLSTLREAGLRVVDWGTEPLATAIARTERRWSR